MTNSQKGFTLIELMIVVAIMGILAAIAVPAYQDYVVRARVSEGLSLAEGAKTAVSEYYSINAAFPSTSSGNTNVGLPTSTSITGNNVKSVAVSGSKITITYAANAAITGKNLVVFVESANNSVLKWDCRNGATAMDSKYLPSACK